MEMTAAGIQGCAFQTQKRQAVEFLEAKRVEGAVLVHELQDKGVLNLMRGGMFGFHFVSNSCFGVALSETTQRKQHAEKYSTFVNKDEEMTFHNLFPPIRTFDAEAVGVAI